MADIQNLVDQLSALTVLEAADLAKALEEKWGVSAAAAVARRASPQDRRPRPGAGDQDRPHRQRARSAAGPHLLGFCGERGRLNFNGEFSTT